jgi:hypothetical protein
MGKKIEFYEGEEAAKRFDAGMKVLLGPKSSQDAKKLPQAQAKPIGKNLNGA